MGLLAVAQKAVSSKDQLGTKLICVKAQQAEAQSEMDRPTRTLKDVSLGRPEERRVLSMFFMLSFFGRPWALGRRSLPEG